MDTKFLVDQLRSVKTEQFVTMSDDMVDKALAFYKKVHYFDSVLWDRNINAGYPYAYSMEEITRMAVVSALSDTSMDDTRL